MANTKVTTGVIADDAITSAKIDSTSTGMTFADLTVTGEIVANGGIALGDSDQATFGDSDDLVIYHDGSNSYVRDTGTGDLRIQATNLRIEATSGEDYLYCASDGAVTVYYDNAAKLATTSTGIDVTGTVTADGLTVDGDAEISDTTPSLLLMESDTTDVNTRLLNNGGDFFLSTINDAKSSVTNRLSLDHATGDISFYDDTGVSQALFWDASAEALAVGGTNTFTSKIVASAANGTAYASNSQLRISGGGTNNNRASIIFSDDALSDGKISYYPHATESSRLLSLSARTTESDFVIKGDGNVGIGTTPHSNSKLHILDASSSLDDYTIHIEAYQPAVVWQDISGGPSTDFALQADGSALMFRYGDAATETQLASEAMRINSSGNLLVGTTESNPTSSAVNVAGQAFSTTGGVRSTVASNPAGTFNRKTDNGDVVIFRKDGATVGSIGSEGGDSLYIVNGDTGLRFVGGVDSIVPANANGAVRDAAIDIGYSTQRFRDIYLSGGIHLGGTTSANYLDDYEEGTWTPTVTNQTTPPTGVTYSVRSGSYTKIGNKVYFEVAIRLSAYTAGTGQLKITGLPFSMTNIAAYKHPAFSINLLDKDSTIASQVWIAMGDEAPSIFWRRLDTDEDTPLDPSYVTAGTSFIGSGVYTTTA